MKKVTVLVAFALALCTSYSFAAPVDGIDASFRHDFQKAQLLSSEDYKTFTKFTFKMNEQVMFAFYSPNGELLAVTRNIPSSQLPVSLLMNLKKHLDSSWITDLFEFNSDAQNCYYVAVENADSKVTLRSNGNEWEVYSTVKKEAK